MDRQNQRVIGWLVVIIGVVALAAPRLRSQSAAAAATSLNAFRKPLALPTAARWTWTTTRAPFT